VPAPKRLRTRPATAGPMARATVNWIELSRTALTSDASGTSEGTNACHDVMLMPEARADRKSTPRIDPSEAWPEIQMPHRANAAAICTVWVTSNTVRRG
jgi:hypothetical protein